MTLAAQLRSTTDWRRAYEARQRHEALIDANAQARIIAQEMIEVLPGFLANVTSHNRSSAYLVGLHVYPPRYWSVNLPNCSPLSLDSCCEELVGVPLHLARWAFGQGLRVYLQNHHNYSKEQWFSWRGREPQERGEGSTGLCVSW